MGIYKHPVIGEDAEGSRHFQGGDTLLESAQGHGQIILLILAEAGNPQAFCEFKASPGRDLVEDPHGNRVDGILHSCSDGNISNIVPAVIHQIVDTASTIRKRRIRCIFYHHAWSIQALLESRSEYGNGLEGGTGLALGAYSSVKAHLHRIGPTANQAPDPTAGRVQDDHGTFGLNAVHRLWEEGFIVVYGFHGPLNILVHGGIDLISPAEYAFQILCGDDLLRLLSHIVHKILEIGQIFGFCYLGRSDSGIQGKRFLFQGLRFLVRYIVYSSKPIQDNIPAFGCPFRIRLGIIEAGRFRQASQGCCLQGAQVKGMLIKIGDSSGLHTIGAIPERNGIAVVGQNLFFRKPVFNLHSQQNLPDLPHVADGRGVFVYQKDASGQLLRDCAGSLGPSRCDKVGESGTDDPLDAETLVLIEFSIFRCNNGRQEIRGHLIQRNRGAVLVLKAHTYNRIILIINLGGACLIEVRLIPDRKGLGKVGKVNGQDSNHEN